MKESSGVIVKVKDKILLCKRAKTNSEPGIWAIPMGGIEDMEEPIDAAYREFHEEMGVELNSDLKYLGKIRRFAKGGQIKSLLHIFLYESDKKLIPDLNSAKDGFEHSECGYFNKEEILNLNMSNGILNAILEII